MHVLKEATQSSKIEGTQTNMEEALLEKEDVAPDKRDDWEEVQNYVAAMNEAIAKLQTLPFSARLIRAAHKTLLRGVRGKHKQPGEFRRSQNWIGGATISDAVFVPPVHTSIGELMGDIEQFVHNDTQYFPELLKLPWCITSLKPSTRSWTVMAAWGVADYLVSGQQGNIEAARVISVGFLRAQPHALL